MTAIEAAILAGFGVPIAGLCMLFVHKAGCMMRAEEQRERNRAAEERARRYEAARRKARGTPQRRPGGMVIR